MSLHTSRRCIGILGHVAPSSSCLSRTWSATLVVHHRCYTTPAAAQKTKEKPAIHASSPPATSRTTGKAKTPKGAALEDKAKERIGRTTGEELEAIETLHRMTEMNEVDVSSAPLDLLDLHVPTWRSYKEDAGIIDHLGAIHKTQRNWLQNVRAYVLHCLMNPRIRRLHVFFISMYQIAKDRSIPGVKVKSPWSWQIFAAQSTSSNSWLALFRQAALEAYKQANEAVAARDEKIIKSLAAGQQQLTYTKLIRSQDPRYINVWKFHGERSPTKVVSIRSMEAYYGAKAPRTGSRLVVQALVRFDTLQSVETYSKKTGARVGETPPKPVVEYLVFQKRMWYDSPWIIRDRLYESLESRYHIPQ